MSNRIRLLVAAMVLLAGACVAAAQSSGGPYQVAPVAIAGGGGAAGGGTFLLRGTFGQAATAALAAQGYRLHAGFWAPDADAIFANGFDQ